MGKTPESNTVSSHLAERLREAEEAQYREGHRLGCSWAKYLEVDILFRIKALSETIENSPMAEWDNYFADDDDVSHLLGRFVSAILRPDAAREEVEAFMEAAFGEVNRPCTPELLHGFADGAFERYLEIKEQS